MSAVSRLLRGLRWLAALPFLVVLVSFPAQAASKAIADTNPFDGVGRAYLVEVDGAVVWHKGASQRVAPASLTKLMTALLVAEALAPSTPVTVSQTAARETGSRLGLLSREVLTAEDLLAATLIASANDACRALADHLGGNQAQFVAQMNARAQQMALHNTHFTNACGHDAPKHYASAQDLRVLAHAVMRVPRLAALVGLAKRNVATTDGARRFSLSNKNALIGRYAGAVGVKTGTTPLAGRCLVALARRGSHTVLLVLLQGKDRWWDATDMLDIAFAHADVAP